MKSWLWLLLVAFVWPAESEAASRRFPGKDKLPPTADEKLRLKMQAIRIPEVNLVKTPLPDAIAFLNAASRKNDPAGKGVQIVFFDQVNPPPTVTLQARGLTVAFLLELMMEMTRYEAELREEFVLVRKPKPKVKKQGGGLPLDTEIFRLNEGQRRRLTGR